MPSHSAKNAWTMSVEIASVSAAPRRPRTPSHSSRKMLACPVPNLKDALAARSQILLLQVGQREHLKVAAHRVSKCTGDECLAGSRRPAKQQAAWSCRVVPLEQFRSAQNVELLAFWNVDSPPCLGRAVDPAQIRGSTRQLLFLVPACPKRCKTLFSKPQFNLESGKLLCKDFRQGLLHVPSHAVLDAFERAKRHIIPRWENDEKVIGAPTDNHDGPTQLELLPVGIWRIYKIKFPFSSGCAHEPQWAACKGYPHLDPGLPQKRTL